VRHRVTMAVLGLLALAVVGAGCAIPTQSSPSTMAPSKVPFDLLNPHPPTTTSTQPKASSFVAVQVFFLNATNALTAVQRYVAAPAPLTAVLGALLEGPSSSDPQGIATAIPSNVRVLSAIPTQPGIVTVNMNAAFRAAITGNSIEEAVGQIVATVVVDTGPNTGVLFEIDGQQTSVPIANGSQVTGPVYLIEFL